MEVIPAIDVTAGRSRIVYWPGVASGEGAPTDRPERIAKRFVELGARTIHVVDFEGARGGTPANLEAVGRIAATVATPIQVAGGLEGADNIRLAFAAGATRIVVGMSVVSEPELLEACLEVAGGWLAVGLDPRPERLAAFPWGARAGGGATVASAAPPSVEAVVERLVAQGVARLVLSHAPAVLDPAFIGGLRSRFDVELGVAGGARDLDGIRRLRDAGVDALILGEPLLSGTIEYPAALEAAA